MGLHMILWSLIMGVIFTTTSGLGNECFQMEPMNEQQRFLRQNDVFKAPIQNNGQICSTWGFYNFKTFDGYMYRLNGLCSYILTRHYHSSYEDFNVQFSRSVIKQVPIINSIIMKMEGQLIEVKRNSILVNSKKADLPFQLMNLKIFSSGSSVVFSSRAGITVTWNYIDNLKVELSDKYENQTRGLCGDFNTFPYHNELYKNGAIRDLDAFVLENTVQNSGENCQGTDLQNQTSCNTVDQTCKDLLQSAEMAACTNKLEVSDFLEICLTDSCLCGASQQLHDFCVCATISEYSEQCIIAKGTPKDWRKEKICNFICPVSMQYMECGPQCEKTCSNQEPLASCIKSCVIGCFCSYDKMYDDVRETGCIPASECYCKYAGEIYPPRTVLRLQCQSCTCVDGLWNCIMLPCPGVCSVEGGVHITTFDQRRYTFHGACSYILTQLCKDSSFSVLGELVPCNQNEAENCLTKVVLVLNNLDVTLEIKHNGAVFYNLEQVNLPFSADNMTAFQPTTFYIIVQTGFGVRLDIQLKPIMQLYIHLTTAYSGKTCGLCGNYNDKQLDDFVTPSGMTVQRSNVFTYSWRSDQTCRRTPADIIDPCLISMNKEPYAKMWCSKLTSKTEIFARCHKRVDPDIYLTACLYDTCMCRYQDDCMCAVFSSYVRACTIKGVDLTGWRSTICGKYKDECRDSMEYRYYVNNCQPTCKALSMPDPSCGISFTKIDGCVCKPDLYLRENGYCVKVSQCPCYYMGLFYMPGDKVYINSIKCICKAGKLECDPTILNKTCTTPMIFYNCTLKPKGSTGIECLKSCQTTTVDCFSKECISGCVCPENLLADGRGGCVEPNKCTCVHNGVIYGHMEKATIGCTTCVCVNRRWQCKKDVPIGECMVYGEGNYITFDGKQYRFNGPCEYTLVQDFCGQNLENKTFSIVAENTMCGTTGATCTKTVKVYFKGFLLKLSDDEAEFISPNKGMVSPFQFQRNSLHEIIKIGNGIVLTWNKQSSLSIRIPSNFKNKVCGLCGNFDDNSNNEFNTRSHFIVEDILEFGNSWKLSSKCRDVMYTIEPCYINPMRKAWAQRKCSIILSKTFEPCHSQVDPSGFFDACVKDSCGCDDGGDCDCLCTAVAAYAQACLSKCICVQWRTPDLCPVFCDYYNPNGECEWHYKPCGSNCMKTCRNPGGTCSSDYLKAEGCYPTCPKDKPYFEETSMHCVEQCGCYDQNGKYYNLIDDVVSCNNCETCKCTKAGIKCYYNLNACICEYEGRMYGYNETIFTRYEGPGQCLTVICGPNGTLIRQVEPCTALPPTSTTRVSVTATTSKVSTTTCKPENCTWSTWIDVSNPGNEENGGDFETLENIRRKGYRICEKPREIICVSVKYGKTPAELFQSVICNTNVGLICLNDKQSDLLCQDYKIKLLCCTPGTCRRTTTKSLPTTVSTPTTSRETASTSPITMILPNITETAATSVSEVTGTGASSVITIAESSTTLKTISTTKCLCYHDNKIYDAGVTIVYQKGEDGCIKEVICDLYCKIVTKPLPCTATTPTTTVPQTTSSAVSSITTRVSTTTCQPEKCTWSQWCNFNKPTTGPGGGESETFNKIRQNGINICEKPRNISCQPVNSQDLTAAQSLRETTCDTSIGYTCYNDNQEPGPCIDMQVSVLCCDPGTCEKSTPGTIATSSPSSLTTISTTKCMCLYERKSFEIGATISIETDIYGCIKRLICNLFCRVETEQLPCTTTPTTTATEKSSSATSLITTQVSTTTCQPEKCTWSQWCNFNKPTTGPGGGESETFNKIRQNGINICEKPRNISCQPVNSQDLTAAQSLRETTCDTSIGYTCYNDNQEPGPCIDMQVSVLCCDPGTCEKSTPGTIATSSPSSLTTISTTKCMCLYERKSFEIGAIISTETDIYGCTKRLICNLLCEAVPEQLPCTTTPTTTTTEKSSSATSLITTQESISTSSGTLTYTTSGSSPSASTPFPFTEVTSSYLTSNTTTYTVNSTFPTSTKTGADFIKSSTTTPGVPCSNLQCVPMEKKDVGTLNCIPYEELYCDEGMLPMKIFNNKLCCFISSCPVCETSNGIRYKTDEIWVENCQECTCNSMNLAISCEPVPCVPEPSVECDTGFELVDFIIPPECCPKSECRCNPHLCPEISLSCEAGYEPVLIPSECCLNISCVIKAVCLKDGIEYQPDTQIPSTPGSCEKYYCTNELDETSGFYIISGTTEICNTICAPGEVYQNLPDQCCGKCVQVACAVIVPEIPDTEFTTPSEGYKIIMPGEVWYPTEDKCTGYTCTEVEGRFSTIVVNEKCEHIGPESCEPDEEYKKHSGECCGHCVQTTCVIITASGKIIFLKENGIWAQDNKTCTSYACHRINGKLSTVGTEIKCLHQSQEDCKTGEKYETIAGQCCGHCVKTMCVVTSSSGEIQILKEGDVIYSTDDVCTSYKCVNVSGQLEVVQEVETCAYKNADSCKPGSVFNKPASQCCGTCVETQCYIILPNGEVKLLMVNEKFYPRNDPCTYYQCIQSEGQFFAVIVKQNCQYKSEKDCDRTENYVKFPGECCGICVKNACLITTDTGETKILKVGQTWTSENNRCITYSCIVSQGQVVTSVLNKTCPIITEKDCETGTIEWTSDSCCRVCKPPKACMLMRNTTLMERNGCKGLVEFPYCKGICAPSMSSLSQVSSQMRDECECCTAYKVRKEQVFLDCPSNKRPFSYTYDYVESCACKTIRCRDYP